MKRMLMGDDEPEQGLFQEDGSWKVPPGKWNLNPSEAFERREFLQTAKDKSAQPPAALTYWQS
jgi:hypothetical protein